MIRLALLAALAGSAAHAHSFYSRWCCSSVDGMSGDCAVIPSGTVSATPEGYVVTLTPADHPRVKATLTRLFRYPDNDPSNDRGDPPEAMISTDGNFHACVLPNTQQFRCFYMTPGSS
jgi:hypothetical protein